jgi:hypothetical protein
MMRTISMISQWLKQPYILDDKEQMQLAALAEKYPYFSVLRYMQAAMDGFSAETNTTMQLFRGNWQKYFQKMTALQKPAPQTETPPELPVEAMPLDKELPWITPVYAEDYFRHQGIEVLEEIPEELEDRQLPADVAENPNAQSLMVMMSFSDWLLHFKKQTETAREEEAGKKALKAMWQREKLAAALGEDEDEIPESVFEMAVNSIAAETGLMSETLAEVMIKQGKYDKALEMYHKLSLQNPQKSVYFAQKIEIIIKEQKS